MVDVLGFHLVQIPLCRTNCCLMKLQFCFLPIDDVSQQIASSTALVMEREMTDIENEVLDAIKARTQPLEMKKVLEERMKYFDEDGNLCFEWGKVPTREGKAGYEQAIQFLDEQSPMQKLEISLE